MAGGPSRQRPAAGNVEDDVVGEKVTAQMIEITLGDGVITFPSDSGVRVFGQESASLSVGSFLATP